MSTTAPVLCNSGVWTQVASGSTGITDIRIHGPAFGYLVAIGSSPPNSTTVGAFPETSSGEFKARNIAASDNVYVTPTGTAPITISDITSVAVSGGGGGGGGGAVTVADGASIALGARADAAYTDATGAAAGSLIAIVKWLGVKLAGIQTALGSPFQAGGSIGNASFGAIQSGAWNIASISGSIVLPTGAASAALQSAGNTSLGSILGACQAATPAGTNTIGTVLGPLPTLPVTGQQTATAAAAALPANPLQNGIVITALSANTGTIYVGAAGVSGGSGYPLSAGQSISFAVANASGIFIIGTNSTDKVAFAGN